MTTDIIQALANLELKPATTQRTRLLVARRICRWLSMQYQCIHSERRALLRRVNIMRSGQTVISATVERLAAQAREHRAAELDAIRRALVDYGILTVYDPTGIAAHLGFDSLCDLLNINTVEREQARRDGHTSLEDLVFTAALEDSAARRGKGKSSSPLFEACNTLLLHFMHTRSSRVQPQFFSPGMSLRDIPIPARFPNSTLRITALGGTVTLKRPSVAVCDACGSRVVQR